MNLHKIANRAVQTVHPNEKIILFLAKGQKNSFGIVKSLYRAPIQLEAQVQNDADSGLLHADTVNQTGHAKRFYVNKYDADKLLSPQALIRQQERTGDIVQCADGSFWLVTQVLEEFDLHVVLKAELLTQVPDFSEHDWYPTWQNNRQK